MAVTITPKKLAEGVVNGGGATTIYTNPGLGTITIVHSLYILNAGTTAETFDLSTTSGQLFQDVTVDSGDTWMLPEGQIIVIEGSSVLQYAGSSPGAFIANAYGAQHVTT